MASFNLGRIRGDKGDTGLSGEKGEKGERGAEGAQGISGFTPVFTVKETTTVEEGESARVEIDSADIKNPELSFYIPKGKDGKDALGDMISSIYDAQGKKCDVFEYADLLFNNAMKKSGGEFSGKVKAYCLDNQELCVRNIVVAESFPEDARTGDIFIGIKSEGSITIGEQDVGTKLIVKENGTEVPYIIVGKNYADSGNIALLRSEILPVQSYFDRAGKTDYCLSAADLYLETIYSKSIEKTLLDKLVDAELIKVGKRKIFLPSYPELTEFEYFAENSKRAVVTDGTYSGYWTRGLYSSNNSIINSQGELETLRATEVSGYRPMIVLKSDTIVENIKYYSSHAVKLPEEKRGIYVFDGEAWKECFSLDN